MDKNVIWIDENDNVLGEISLVKAHQEGLLHRISVVYLTNDTNQVLIQKRTDGGLDHSAAGHVDVGESYFEAAKRELEEELGVSGVDLQEIGDCSSNEAGKKIRHRFKVFVCKTNPGKLDPNEVKEVFWANPTKIWDDMRNDKENKKYCGGFKVTLELYLKKTRVHPPKFSEEKFRRAHIFVSGRVQGVLFRYNTRKKAQKLGLAGWVSNLADGRVEAVFEGDKDKIEEILKWARRGPFLAKVENLEIIWENYRGEFTDFEIRR